MLCALLCVLPSTPGPNVASLSDFTVAKLVNSFGFPRENREANSLDDFCYPAFLAEPTPRLVPLSSSSSQQVAAASCTYKIMVGRRLASMVYLAHFSAIALQKKGTLPHLAPSTGEIRGTKTCMNGVAKKK